MQISSRNELSEFRKRYRWMSLFVVLTFLVFASRLVYLQLIQGSALYSESISNIIRTVTIPAVRGRVFDDKGRVLATSVPSHALVAMPHYVDMGKGFARLVQLLEIDVADAESISKKIQERLTDSRDMRRFQQITLLDRITPEQLAAVKTYQDELPGIDVIDMPVRFYPYAGTGGNILGFLNEVNRDDIEKEDSTIEDPFRPGDKIGRSGIERAFEKDLRGVRGWRKKVVDARGLPLSREDSAHLLPEASMQEPRPGYDITLTIDIALQKIVEQALSGHPSAAAVVMEVNTGRVLAAASVPTTDPNLLINGLSYEEYRAIEENPYRPNIDKTIYENYFPGSIYKPFVAMAALEEGIITTNDIVHCSGFHEFGRRTFKCTHRHGDVNLHSALVKSCNVYFYTLAEMTGMNRLARYAREFGFGEKTGIGYNAETAGHVPTREWYDKHLPGQFRIGHTLNTAIGQGNTKVTLMQAAAAYASIANGGTLYKPQIIRRIETPDGDIVKEYNPEVRRRVTITQRNIDVIMEALIDVVEDEDGTAHSAKSSKIQVAGKTGTAQVAKKARKESDTLANHYYKNRDHAWFASLAPADNPQIAVVVLIEHGGGGGEHAAPVGVEISRKYFEQIAPEQETPLMARETKPTQPLTPEARHIPEEDTSSAAAATRRR
ncbi:MAG: penicillin-binding protein 2 [Myxococcales bacterium]|nr:penicillin-binding protein 2 [Myxococcales bacterium]